MTMLADGFAAVLTRQVDGVFGGDGRNQDDRNRGLDQIHASGDAEEGPIAVFVLQL